MTEDTVPHPKTRTASPSMRSSSSCAPATTMFGLDYVIFRPHNVYGPRQNIGDRYRNVIGIFMNQILQGQPMTIFGDGTQTRAFSYIDDVAPIMAEAIDVPAARNQVFNVGADQPYSLNDLARGVAAAMGVTPRIVTCRHGTRSSTPFAHEKIGACLASGRRRRLRTGSRDGRLGPRTRRPPQRAVRPESRS